MQDFFLYRRGGVHACSCNYSISVCKHALYRGVWGHASPGKFFNLQLLRWFLVAPETIYTVWFVSASCGQFKGTHGLKVYLGCAI